MCGIAGFLDPSCPEASELERLARAMSQTLVHRGPDDAGTWAAPADGITLASRRLAVVGLGPGGHQPMSSLSGRWTAVFNGEIYNYSSVTETLGVRSRLRGGSDTEVLLEAFDTWGIDRALDEMEGMFGVGAWDSVRRELHLVRDRFGEKPLYYGWVSGRFAFASELKAIRELPGFTARIDRRAVAMFLRYSCVPAPLSIYEGIYKLLPGEILTLAGDARPAELGRSRTYWSAREAVEASLADRISASTGEVLELLEAALGRSVASRMVADVPVGALLSGGVDSSLVVALMQRHASHKVKTFTVGFKERAYDESADATKVASHLETDHTNLVVTDKEAMEVIPELATVWDEPFSDSSQIPTLLVSRLARSQVTVALTGDGGDELFGGYNRHAWLERILSGWTRVPRALRKPGAALAREMPPALVDSLAALEALLPRRWRLRNPATMLSKTARVLAAGDPHSAYQSLLSHWEQPESLVPGVNRADTLAVRPETWPGLGGITEQMMWLDLVGYLPDDILTKLDRASMAVSLEARVPFLDRGVVDLAWRIPKEMKLRGSTNKWILRQLLYHYVPRDLVERPKMGFGVPLGSWLAGPLRPWAEDLLDAHKLARDGLLSPDPVRRAWKQHLSGRRDLGYELWDVLVLQAWLDRWAPA